MITTELDTLNARLEQLERDNRQMKAQFHTAQRRLRMQAGLAFCGLLGALFLSPGNRSAIAQGYGVTLATLNTRLIAVEAKTQFQSADATAKSTTFSGCNVIINDGGGSTTTIVNNTAGQGLGNLIIGYNAGRADVNNPDIRTGSHNLILGDKQNYSAYGGLVSGAANTISGSYASVTGGTNNRADSFVASISGGANNIVDGPYSAISGGANNTASGNSCAISGGSSNSVNGRAAAISGGLLNIANNDYAAVSGGSSNTASGAGASISGGENHTVAGVLASVSGGNGITQNTDDGWAAGGSGAGTFHSP